MNEHLYYNTITPLLLESLRTLMQSVIFDNFRLVGGSALSLQRGHRMSIDIDFFSDAEYESVDFELIEQFLLSNWPYVDSHKMDLIGFGKSYFIGFSEKECVKLDIYYTNPFIDDCISIDTIRMATINEIVAMKMDVIARGGRKKDFWDIHEVIEEFSLVEMLAFHKKRYPFSHDSKLIVRQLTNFTLADNDFNPVCLHGKHWGLIKLDLLDYVK